MPYPLTIVLSEGQSNHPEKRALESAVAEALSAEHGAEVLLTPNLYDLKPDGPTISTLKQTPRDLLVLSWLYPRAAHWTLDRVGVRGRVGESLLVAPDDEDGDDEDWDDAEKSRVADERELPNRRIYCIDWRIVQNANEVVDELRRIQEELAAENSASSTTAETAWISGQASSESLARFQRPVNDTHLDGNGRLAVSSPAPRTTVGPSSEHAPLPFDLSGGHLRRVDEQPGRRWYPVIDFSRCTNCMECIDFCLFGVYGVDGQETILVEQPDNCRKGCPACSRVCPENAIIFPQHKTPAIAGAEVAVGGLKIDLSKLFGAPESNEDAMAVAARERDEQLLLAGRDAVGMPVRTPTRTPEAATIQPKDDLDALVDALDDLDL